MNPLSEICLRYLDGDLTEAEAEDFDRLIAESPDAARELARHLIDEHYFAKAGANHANNRVDAADVSDASALNLAFRHLERSEQMDQVLRELLRMEREAVALPQDTAQPPSAGEARHPDPLTWREATGALAYLMGQAARSTPGKWLAAAAAVVLASTLLLSFGIGSSADNEPAPVYTQRPQSPTPPAPPTARPAVATLTAEHNAQWSQATGATAPAIGTKLQAGQTLTLRRGTAQLTTQLGAIANLQAPCTVELLEGGNALRLIEGKLFGICETQASKGFVVHTSFMEITDLGTRFGVDASRAERTEVHIFEGEVMVASPRVQTNGRQRIVTQGQAIAARADTPGLVTVESDSDRFVSIQSPDLLNNRPVPGMGGIVSISGTLQAASAAQFADKEMDRWPAGDNAFVFHDFVGRLVTEAKVDVAETGNNSGPPGGTGALIPAETDVRSYIIIKAGKSPDVTLNAQGSVTFENEVIGIITDQATDQLFAAAAQATSPVFSPGGGAERWLDPNVFGERVAISEDRRTVTFQFEVKQAVDTIRVLVRAEGEDANP